MWVDGCCQGWTVCVCGVHFVWCVAWLMFMVYVGYVSGVYVWCLW